MYPFRGCIIATFVTKTWLSTVMWDKNSVMCCWHKSICVLIQKYLHVAGLNLGLGVLASFNITGSKGIRPVINCVCWYSIGGDLTIALPHIKSSGLHLHHLLQH